MTEFPKKSEEHVEPSERTGTEKGVASGSEHADPCFLHKSHEFARIRSEALSSAMAIAPLHAACDIADEVVSAVFAKRHIINLVGYARKAARTRALNWMKRESKHVSIQWGSVPQITELSPSDHLDCEEAKVIIAELLLRIDRDVLSSMETRDRELYQLIYEECLTIEQIAVRLDMPRNSVSQRWRRLLWKLSNEFSAVVKSFPPAIELFGNGFPNTYAPEALLRLSLMLRKEGGKAIASEVEAAHTKVFAEKSNRRLGQIR